MKPVMALMRRELAAFLNAPVGALTLIAAPVFALIWLFFIERFFARGEASLRPFFGFMPIVLTFLAPAVTMRAWAEEKRQGTLELLLALPISPAGLVLGKFLAAWTLLAMALALSLPLPFLLAPLGDFDSGAIAAEYIGLLLLSGAAAAIGQYLSMRSENQAGAYLVSVLVLLSLTLLNQVNAILELPSFLSGALNWVSLGFHFQAFSRGVLDSRDLAYFILVGATFLLLGAEHLSERKRS